ncbi:short-chain dehydrogenase/reductase family protein [Nitzschia inconspicua]|uniref:Short-chain dehydrogenase/reductase family protein n=1 Tax=Nitzschia inconspicua TaxID=303405 RepID=A0A9K3LCZ7_9STRA|nr:short-chain dehydrogenase/reductase family protein [Nitzschia inconspicua]
MSIPSDSCCLVVGATNPTSIGYQTALTLLQAGVHHVSIMGRNQEKLDKAVLLLSTIGGTGKVSGVLGDLKKPESMKKVVEEACEQMGGKLDCLICCGGNGYSEYLGLDVSDLESYRLMQNVAILSPMVLAEAAFPHLHESKNPGGGTIVMVGSVSADVPWPNTAPHNFAMAGKNTMMQTLAFKYRRENVRVNLVAAGVIHSGALDTMAKKKNIPVETYAALRADSQPLGRNGTLEDVSNAVLYLASPASGFTTGEIIRVDGGLHLSNWWNRQVMLKEYVGGSS